MSGISNVSVSSIKSVIKKCISAHTKESQLAELSTILASLGLSGIDELREVLIDQLQLQRAICEYNRIFTEMEGESWFIFMNHGYLPEQDEIAEFPALGADDDKWRHQNYLYFYLMNLAKKEFKVDNLAQYELLDIGCGRGGGLSAMKRYYKPARAVGVDINARQITFCKARYPHDGMEFVRASALTVPFKDESFDIITNVESSHMYSNIGRFLGEVRRLLKHGGLFLIADVRERGIDTQLLELDLLSSGLEVTVDQDITGKVRGACILDMDRFTESAFNSKKAEFPRRIARNKANEYSSSGAGIYVTYALKKI